MTTTPTLPPSEPEAPELSPGQKLALQYRQRPDLCRRIVAELTRLIEADKAREAKP